MNWIKAGLGQGRARIGQDRIGLGFHGLGWTWTGQEEKKRGRKRQTDRDEKFYSDFPSILLPLTTYIPFTYSSFPHSIVPPYRLATLHLFPTHHIPIPSKPLFISRLNTSIPSHPIARHIPCLHLPPPSQKKQKRTSATTRPDEPSGGEKIQRVGGCRRGDIKGEEKK